MKGYKSGNIRNIALLGHGGCGKTTFLESALLTTGVISKAGKVESGNTVSDYDKMETEKGFSINAAVVPVEWKGNKINFIDTPGYPDFIGEVYAALSVAGAAVIMVDAGAGIQVGTEQAWKACNRFNIPRFFVINKRDKDELDISKTLEDLRSKFGTNIAPLEWPLGDDIDEELKEAVAGTDDELMEKYFEGEDFTEEEFRTGLVKGISAGEIVPLCTSVYGIGQKVDGLLDLLSACAPSPLQHAPYKATGADGNEEEIEPSADAPASAFVFKTIVDPFVGKISVMKVMTGKISAGDELYIERVNKTERIGKVVAMRGKTQSDIAEAEAGDIVAVAKLANARTGDTLCQKDSVVNYAPVSFPEACYYVAIEPKEKADEEKMGTGLGRLREEDPTISVERNSETHQTLLGGQGDMQISIVLARLKDRYGVDVNIVPQKIAYRETIKGSSDVQGKHKKQTGGAGQYGDVHIRFSPSQEDFEFSEEIFGGAIPKNYIPAVEKGLRECLDNGPLAGCRVQGVKAVLYDGSYHEVDSNEVSFKVAASIAFKKGIKEANPCLLEPIMSLEIIVPGDNTGDVMGDVTKRRGRIMGMEPQHDGSQKLIALVPQAELFDYALGLRAMTQGRGSFTMKFNSYAEVPKNLADKIIEEHEKEEA